MLAENKVKFTTKLNVTPSRINTTNTTLYSKCCLIHKSKIKFFLRFLNFRFKIVGHENLQQQKMMKNQYNLRIKKILSAIIISYDVKIYFFVETVKVLKRNHTNAQRQYLEMFFSFVDFILKYMAVFGYNRTKQG